MASLDNRRHQVFPVLDPAQFAIACRFASGPEQRFAPNEIIYAVGQRGVPAWLISAGAIAIVRRDGLGHEMPLAELGPGQFTGEVGQLAGQASLAAARAGAAGCVACPLDAVVPAPDVQTAVVPVPVPPAPPVVVPVTALSGSQVHPASPMSRRARRMVLRVPDGGRRGRAWRPAGWLESSSTRPALPGGRSCTQPHARKDGRQARRNEPRASRSGWARSRASA